MTPTSGGRFSDTLCEVALEFFLGMALNCFGDEADILRRFCVGRDLGLGFPVGAELADEVEGAGDEDGVFGFGVSQGVVEGLFGVGDDDGMIGVVGGHFA